MSENNIIKIKTTRKKHKDSNYNRFKITHNNYVTDKAEVIYIDMGNCTPLLCMEIIDNEINLWLSPERGKLTLKTPVIDDTAFFKLEYEYKNAVDVKENKFEKDYIYLENLQCSLIDNKDNLTLKELNELYGENYVPPFFVQNYGRIFPFSQFWVNKLIQLDTFVGKQRARIKKETETLSQGMSRSWKNNERKHDKMLLNQIFKEENKNCE